MRMLTVNEFAKMIGKSPRHTQRLMSDGEGPPIVRLGKRAIGIMEADAEAWLAGRRETPPGWLGGQPIADMMKRPEVQTVIGDAVADAVSTALEAVVRGRRSQAAI